MPRSALLVIPLCLALLVPPAALAQEENSPHQTQTSSIGAMPSRGMSMDQVKQHFGEARQQLAPVGNPPITRWLYDGMTVYFEHQYVIHAVASGGGGK